MTYGNCICNKIEKVFFFNYENQSTRNYFGVVGVICNWYLAYHIRILCLFLYIWSWTIVMFWKMSQKCEQFSYEILLVRFFNFWVLNGPLTSLKHPSEGYNVLSKNQVGFSLNIMFRVSFSPGRDSACHHSWTSSFWTPSGKRVL